MTSLKHSIYLALWADSASWPSIRFHIACIHAVSLNWWLVTMSVQAALAFPFTLLLNIQHLIFEEFAWGYNCSSAGNILEIIVFIKKEWCSRDLHYCEHKNWQSVELCMPVRIVFYFTIKGYVNIIKRWEIVSLVLILESMNKKRAGDRQD